MKGLFRRWAAVPRPALEELSKARKTTLEGEFTGDEWERTATRSTLDNERWRYGRIK